LVFDEVSASADRKRVAVVFSRDSFSLFVANLSKTGGKLEQPLRLTLDYLTYAPGGWTGDSQTLFYTSNRLEQGRRTNSIYKSRISSNSAELFLENYAMWDLSPDGTWVMVTANRREWLRVPVAGGTPEKVVMAGVGDVHCAHMGSRICVLSEDVGTQKVFSILDPLRGRLGELAKIDIKDKAYRDWSLSPDGSRIALVDFGSDTVLVLNLQSKQMQEFHPVPPQKALQTPAWSADGRQLFLSGREGMLLEMDASGHTRLLLEHPTGWIGYPCPSPDGKRIAYTYTVSESNVTLLENF
jgi:Tol biopolymer transport system component